MNKRSLLILPLASMIILSACGSDDQQAKLTNDANKNENASENKNHSKEKAYQKKKPKSYDDRKDKEKSKDLDVKTTSLDDAIGELDYLNDFVVEDDEWFGSIVQKYNKQGIILDSDFSSPYNDNATSVNADQPYVLVGTALDKDVDKQDKNHAKLTYKVKAALVSGIEDKSDIDEEAAIAKSKMEKDKDQGKEYTLKYDIKKKDGKWHVTRDVPSSWTEDSK